MARQPTRDGHRGRAPGALRACSAGSWPGNGLSHAVITTSRDGLGIAPALPAIAALFAAMALGHVVTTAARARSRLLPELVGKPPRRCWQRRPRLWISSSWRCPRSKTASGVRDERRPSARPTWSHDLTHLARSAVEAGGLAVILVSERRSIQRTNDVRRLPKALVARRVDGVGWWHRPATSQWASSHRPRPRAPGSLHSCEPCLHDLPPVFFPVLRRPRSLPRAWTTVRTPP